MTGLDEDIAGNMPIKPENYEFLIRALWRSTQANEKQLQIVLECIQDLSATTKETKDSVDTISRILTISGNLASVIKWTAYVVVPIIGLAFGIYTFFHNRQPH